MGVVAFKEKSQVLAEQYGWPLPSAKGYVDGETFRKRHKTPPIHAIVEITGSEALRIVVDSHYGMYRRCFVPLAECFSIDIAFGAGERPAVLLGENLRLFLERDDAHETSLYSS